MSLVGLDIGSKTIKAVELVSEKDRYMLKAAGVISYNGVDLEHIQDEKDFINLSDTIKKLFKDIKISTKNVNLSLPESQVFTRSITYPALTDQEIASAIKWEAEQYIPIPINEAIVQHQILERRPDTSPPEVSVLLVASPRALSEKYVKIVSSAGLNCVSVETELIALSRSLAPDNQTAMLIDFGARSTDLAIVKNGMLMFSRSIPTGGDAFTRAVAQYLGVNPNQAEEYKRTYGLSVNQLEGKVGAAIDPVFKIVSEEIKKAIHFYQTEQKGGQPSVVILSGGASGMPEASTYLARTLGIEVAIGNPFSKVNLNPNVSKTLSAYGPLYSISVGLAMRSI